MRIRHLVVVTIALGSFAAARGEQGLLQVAPRIRFVQHGELARVCDTSRDIDGCTEFRGRQLRCACEPADAGWHIRPAAQFIPYVYLWKIGVARHEYDHIGDIRGSAEEYLRILSAARFEDQRSCRAAAGREERLFIDRMNGWALDSNRKRHPGTWRNLGEPARTIAVLQ